MDPLEMLKFDERLYTLNVDGVKQYEVPKIIDPNDDTAVAPVGVLCYEPDKRQEIQLSLIIWQVATRERNNTARHYRRDFEIAENLCTYTRENLKSLLMPFVDGDKIKARDLCLRLLAINKNNLDKYLVNWQIALKPSTVWIDEDSNRIFLAKTKNGIVVGLNPTNHIFLYKEPIKGTTKL